MKTGGGQIVFAEPNAKLQGKFIENIPVVSPEKILSYDYEKIIVASTIAYPEIVEELKNKYSIPAEKIDTGFSELSYYRSIGARIKWLEDFSAVAKFHNYAGSCAEVGVFNGNFAKHINRCFPEKNLYLFDTFTGFDVRDIAKEKDLSLAVGWDKNDFNALYDVEEISKKMVAPDKVVFKVGYFPETAEGLEDKFCFVNLDVDLYAPTLAGLEFFYPKMIKGGVILIHDYFEGLFVNPKGAFVGIKKAVTEFAKKYNLSYLPIGDAMSVAFVKN